MLSIFLPLYEQSPRDLASTQWRPLRIRTANMFSGGASLAFATIDVPSDECWLLDSVLMTARGAAAITGPPAFPANAVASHLLAFNDPALPGAFGHRIVNLMRFIEPAPTDDTFRFQRLPSQLFVAPSARIMYEATFTADNPNSFVNIQVSGIAIPKGNMSQ